ncbi:ABC transporter permease [Robertmurraya kyonggiensis]|uniref:ABC transporter permease n=1 Tax=Robertmurraya kyonggiensis TaxID=1037680 RepID=A0A4V5P540_9BACI|nr:ABC transporter permease [Robertmurraya kyonggiensis]TKC19100.1 ABC transporter permease [Robertmurraya kyonggiensis]
MFINKYGLTTLSYKAVYSYQSIKLFILFRIVDPFMHYIFFATLASALVGTSYLKFVVLGNIVYYTCQTMMINFINMFRMERRYGTLELNIASPTNTLYVIIKKGIVPLLDSLFVFLISIILGGILFDLNLPINNIVNIIFLCLVTMFTMFCFSLLFACISLVFSNVNLFLNITLAFLQIFCGVNFGVNKLPEVLEFISRLLPLTHSIEALRTIYRITKYEVTSLLLKELTLGFCYLILSLILVISMEKLARKNGELFKDI